MAGRWAARHGERKAHQLEPMKMVMIIIIMIIMIDHRRTNMTPLP